jgi:hypothetical protein
VAIVGAFIGMLSIVLLFILACVIYRIEVWLDDRRDPVWCEAMKCAKWLLGPK